MTFVRRDRGQSRLVAAPMVLAMLGLCVPMNAQEQSIRNSPSIAPSSQAIHQELRIVWGGPGARAYEGSLSVSNGKLRAIRNLSTQSAAAGSVVSFDASTLEVRPHGDTTFGGLDIAVDGTESSRIRIRFRTNDPEQPIEHEVALLDLQQGTWVRSLDSGGNRVAIERPTYDKLRIAEDRPIAVKDCGEPWSFQATGYRTGLPKGSYLLTASWAAKTSSAKQPIHLSELSRGHGHSMVASIPVDVDSNGNFASVKIEAEVPKIEGPHRMELSLVRPSLVQVLQPPKPLLSRSVEIVAFDAQATPHPIAQWKSLWTFDTVAAIRPNSPSWLAGHRSVNSSGEIGVRPMSIDEASNNSQSRQCVTISSQGWLSIPLPGLQVGHPHRLRIDVPADQSNHLNISIQDSADRTQAMLCPQSNILIGESDKHPGAVVTHDVIFWPRSESISVVLASAHRSQSASVGKLSLESSVLGSGEKDSRGENRDVATSIVPNSSERHVAVYLDQPYLADCFAAPRETDSTSGRALESWATWQAVAERLVHQLQLAQADTLVLTAVTDGAALFPIETVQTVPWLDKSPFFSDGRATDGHDALELIFRHFDRAGLRLVVEVDLNSPLTPFADQASNEREWIQVDVKGKPSMGRKDGRTNVSDESGQMNPLNPSVQSAIQQCVREIAQRYRHHDSFAGVSLRLRGSSPLVFGGERLGYNAELLKRYATQAGLTLPNATEELAELMSGPARLGFLTWRAGQLTEFYSRLAKIVRDVRPDADLTLNTIRLWEKSVVDHTLVDREETLRNPQQYLLTFGLDMEGLSRIDGLVVAQGTIRHGWMPLANRDWSRVSAAEQGAIIQTDFPQAAFPQAAFITHQPRTKRLAPDGREPSQVSSPSQIYVDSVVGGLAARKALVDQLARTDLQLLAFGGWYPIWTLEPQLAELVSTFRSLPPIQLRDVPLLPSEYPVRIRKGFHDGKTILTILHSSALQGSLSLSLSGDLPPTIQRLGQQFDASNSERVEFNSGKLEIELAPYALAAWSVEGELDLVAADYRVNHDALATIAQQFEQLESMVASAIDPISQRTLFKVGGTFENWTDDSRPVDWNVSSLPDTRIQRTTELPHSGASAICIESNHQEQVPVWIQSTPIELPQTGRLAVRAWLRSAAADHRQPTVRLGLVGRLRNGQRYQQSILYGGKDHANRPLASDWGRRPAELHVADVPIDELTELQVAIDLIGPGKIWVDDVEVEETWLHPDERNYLRGQLLVARQKLAEGNPFSAEKMIRSPWYQYLAELDHNTKGERTARVSLPSRELPRVQPTQWDRQKSTFQQWREGLFDRWRR